MDLGRIAATFNFPQLNSASPSQQPSSVRNDADGDDDSGQKAEGHGGLGGPGAFLDAVFKALGQIGATPAAAAPGTTTPDNSAAASGSTAPQTSATTDTTTVTISVTASSSTSASVTSTTAAVPADTPATPAATTDAAGTAAATDGTATTANPLQALGAFLHNLFGALQSFGATGRGHHEGDDGGEHHRHGGFGRLESKLQSLIQLLASQPSGPAAADASTTPAAAGTTATTSPPPATAPDSPASSATDAAAAPATTTPPTDTTVTTPATTTPAPAAPPPTLPPAVVKLQESYKVLLASLGLTSSGSSLGGFLQALYQNLQGFRSSGNLVNTQA